jgi:hypothetical protein
MYERMYIYIVYMYIYICICTFAHVYVHILVHIHMRRRNVQWFKYLYMYVCMNIYTYRLPMYKRMYMHAYKYVQKWLPGFWVLSGIIPVTYDVAFKRAGHITICQQGNCLHTNSGIDESEVYAYTHVIYTNIDKHVQIFVLIKDSSKYLCTIYTYLFRRIHRSSFWRALPPPIVSSSIWVFLEVSWLRPPWSRLSLFWCLYLYAYVCIILSPCTCMYIYVHTHIHIHTYMNKYMYIYI